MKKLKAAILVFFLIPHFMYPCTTFCGKDTKGQVWVGNNEDRPFSFVNYLNIFPKSSNTK
jgi:penicillin V acylase-like amidase (Ntn superfamily)